MLSAIESVVRMPPGSRLIEAATFPGIRLEKWQLAAGTIAAGTFEYNEIASVVSGRSLDRRPTADGSRRVRLQPGMTIISPAGVALGESDITDTMEILRARLPRTLTDKSALESYGIDATLTELVHCVGVSDPILYQIMLSLQDSMTRNDEPTNSLFVDGLKIALTAHLIMKYARVHWHPPVVVTDFDPKRLRRVLDLIEDRFAHPLSLAQLASEACVSEFHFSRLFRASTGLSPYRYVTRRRVQAAQALLDTTRGSLLEIALDAGFGSQANFIRLFRKSTGLTPGQYRAIHGSKHQVLTPSLLG